MSAPRAAGRRLDVVLGLALVAAIVLRAWWSADRNVSGPDLNPRPDALEYALAAESLGDGYGCTLDLEGVRYPTRYPPGFAIVAAPVVRAFGIDRAWWTSLAMGSLVVLLGAVLGRIAGGRIGFVVAAGILLLSPASLGSARLAMSETTSQFGFCAALLGAALLHWRATRPRVTLFAAASAVAAFSVLVRYTNLAFVAPLALLALRRGHDGASGERSTGLFTATIALSFGALVALALRNVATFGHPLHDGYRFWVPELYASGLTFSITYLWKPLAELFPSGNLAAYAPQLAGLSAHLWTWPVALLATIGFGRAFALRKSCPCAATLFVAGAICAPSLVAFHSIYAWQDPRFLEPLIPLVAALAAFGAAALAARFGDLASGIVVAVVLAHLVHVARPVLAPPRAPLEPAALLPFLERGAHALDESGARPDLAIVDFEPAFARRVWPRDTELVVADLESAAPHFARILDRDLPGLDGRRAAIRALSRKGAVVDSEIEAVRAAVAAGERVVYLEAKREGEPGLGIASLRSEFRFVELRMVPESLPVDSRDPPVRAFELRKR